MKKTAFFFLIIIIFSCKTSKQNSNLNYGSFKAMGKDFNHELILNSNSTFTISFKHLGTNPTCSGNWNFIGNDSITLNCNKPTDITETLQGGYLNERVMHLKIINSNELLFKNIHFKR